MMNIATPRFVSPRLAGAALPVARSPAHRRCLARTWVAIVAAPTAVGGLGEEMEVAVGSVLNSSKLEHGDLLMSWEEDDSTDADALSSWMRDTVCQQLVGVTAKTSRAQVTTTGVRSGVVTKGQIRANFMDVVLELEGKHLKEQLVTKGTVRLVLKTESNLDSISLAPVKWDVDPSMEGSRALLDIKAAAETPMESALSIRLNDLLWDVERKSMDSMDPAEVAAARRPRP